MNIEIKKFHPKATIPKYSREGDAGMDLVAVEWTVENTLYVYKTGIGIKIPEGHVGLLYPRSSISKYDLSLANHVGVIDSNYVGEIILKFRKTDICPNIYLVGDRIAQLIIVPYPTINFVEVKELQETNRGSNGFGSSGA